MLRTRTQSNYLKNECSTKKHCHQDQSCRGCCPCVAISSQQRTILLGKIKQLGREKSDLQNMMLKLSKRIRDYEKNEKECQDIEEIKNKLREEVRRQIEQARRVEDLLIKQKINNLKQDNNQFKQVNQILTDSINQLKQQYAQQQINRQKLQHQLATATSVIQQKEQYISQNKQKIQKILKRIQVIEKSNSEKSHLIQQLQKVIAESQNNYMLERAKAANNYFQSLHTQQQLKITNNLVQELKKMSEQKNGSITTLTSEKNKLGQIVQQLDKTVYSYSMLKSQLQDRIVVTQGYALQKQMQAKRLEMDYYDVLHRLA